LKNRTAWPPSRGRVTAGGRKKKMHARAPLERNKTKSAQEKGDAGRAQAPSDEGRNKSKKKESGVSPPRLSAEKEGNPKSPSTRSPGEGLGSRSQGKIPQSTPERESRKRKKGKSHHQAGNWKRKNPLLGSGGRRGGGHLASTRRRRGRTLKPRGPSGKIELADCCTAGQVPTWKKRPLKRGNAIAGRKAKVHHAGKKKNFTCRRKGRKDRIFGNRRPRGKAAPRRRSEEKTGGSAEKSSRAFRRRRGSVSVATTK